MAFVLTLSFVFRIKANYDKTSIFTLYHVAIYVTGVAAAAAGEKDSSLAKGSKS